MAALVVSEYVGGRVLSVEDFDPGTLQQVGGATLSGPAGLAVHPSGDVLVAELEAHRLAVAPPGQGWRRFGSAGGPGQRHLTVGGAVGVFEGRLGRTPLRDPAQIVDSQRSPGIVREEMVGSA